MILINPWDSTSVTTDLRPAAALIEIERSIDRESSVCLEPDRPWRRYLERLKSPLGLFRPAHVRRVEGIWDAVRARLPAPVPLPFTQPTAGGAIQIAWYSPRYSVEVDVLPDGRLDWFFRDRTTGVLAGTDDEPVAELPPEFFSRLASALA